MRKLIALMESRVLEADATDRSRLAWLYLNVNDESSAIRHTIEGLRIVQREAEIVGVAPDIDVENWPKDVIAGYIKAKGTSSVKGGNRLTLLRDADGDGKYEMNTVFADNLNAPYGLAFANNKLYVANQDELVSFDYQEGQTKAGGPPASLARLPSEINHHWTKNVVVDDEGSLLYVTVGSNSNVAERGIEAEAGRTRPLSVVMAEKIAALRAWARERTVPAD